MFYEGPPTANGMPGTHHIEARVFKDVFPRFKTMQGYHVPRRAGWDCHGLPVELAVEKELGFTGKPDIEAYGIAEFNARCRESVQRHVDAFAELTERMGYWVDMSTTPTGRWTRTTSRRVWWSLKQIFDKGLLVEDHRVAPYCPRCGTGLSDHEVAQGYETVVDPSVYVRFPAHLRRAGPARPTCWSGRRRRGRWCPTPPSPCTPTSPTSSPRDGRRARSSSPSRCWPTALGEELRCWPATFTGRELERWTYQRPFDLVDFPDDDAHFVVLADYVTTEDGTGLVHQSPAFGADDLAVCRALRPAGGQPGRRRRALPGRRPAGRRACSSRTPTPPLVEDLQRRAGCCSGDAAVRAQLPALLALPHAADLLRAAVLVHPHHRRSRTQLLAREREDQLVPGDDQARPLRRLAEQQRRLGAVPRPLLGHAAADLALRRDEPR